MNQIQTFLFLALTSFTAGALGQEAKSTSSTTSVPHAQQPSAPRVVELKAPDGTILKATYFAAVKPGPGVLLLHQSNRTRKSWDKLAPQLAAAGFNTLTLDMCGFGESGGKTDKPTRLTEARDVDTAFQYLVSQPGVKRDVIGVGGAGWLGIDNAV